MHGRVLMKFIKNTQISMTLMTLKVIGLKVKVADYISRKCTFLWRQWGRRFAVEERLVIVCCLWLNADVSRIADAAIRFTVEKKQYQ